MRSAAQQTLNMPNQHRQKYNLSYLRIDYCKIDLSEVLTMKCPFCGETLIEGDLSCPNCRSPAIDMIMNSSKVSTYNFQSGDDTGMTILKAQEKFKESAGSYANLNSMAVSYKSLTTLKSDIFENNRKVEPVELIKSYYGVDNIDILGTAVCDGGSEIGDKTYIGMDYINPGIKLLYSRTTGTTVAPLGPDCEMYDFYPLIEFMRKDIRDELPMYTKLFILSSVGVLMNAPNRIIKGNFRA